MPDRSLAATAARERDERLRRFPAMVAERAIDRRLAVLDAECWATIADWLDGRCGLIRSAWCHRTGATVDVDGPALRAALDRALATRRAAAEKHPGDANRAAALADVEAVAASVTRALDFLDRLNADLRARAAEAQGVAA